jgi:hypothetical protein
VPAAAGGAYQVSLEDASFNQILELMGSELSRCGGIGRRTRFRF